MRVEATARPGRVLGIFQATGASAYYRLAVPLRSHPDGALAVFGQVPQGHLDAAEVVVFSRISAPPEAIRTLFTSLKRGGKRVIVDVDDDMLGIPASNPAGRRDTSGVRAALSLADAVTCTNPTLAGRLRPLNREVRVLPNYCRADDWTAVPTSERPLTVGLAGSPSHLADWQIVTRPLTILRYAHPETRIITAGLLPPYLRDLVDEHVPWGALPSYPGLLARFDIGLCPLPDTRFNRCKSPIKAMEYALAGAAVIGSPTQYAPLLADGRGVVATTPRSWEAALLTYAGDAELRRREAARLREHVVEQLDARQHVAQIVEAYR